MILRAFTTFMTALCLVLLASAAAHATAAQRATPVPAQPAVNVDVALVLAVDVSGSIDYREADLQRRGIVSAFTSPEVINAIQSGNFRQIAVAVVFFSSADFGIMGVPVKWMLVKDRTSALEFAKALGASSRPSARGTSISDALLLSQQVFAELPYRATKKVIDVSGDGANNAGRPILEVRGETLGRDITINGLAILEGASQPDLDKIFASCVIGGPGAFVLVAETFQDFARAMRRKLVLELSSLPDEGRVIRAAASPAPPRLELPAPRGYSQPTPTPYAGGCDFWMFGGFGFGFR
jgi:hypothetical protein